MLDLAASGHQSHQKAWPCLSTLGPGLAPPGADFSCLPACKEGLLPTPKPICHYPSNFAMLTELIFWGVCPTHLYDLIIENKRVKKEQNILLSRDDQEHSRQQQVKGWQMVMKLQNSISQSVALGTSRITMTEREGQLSISWAPAFWTSARTPRSFYGPRVWDTQS